MTFEFSNAIPSLAFPNISGIVVFNQLHLIKGKLDSIKLNLMFDLKDEKITQQVLPHVWQSPYDKNNFVSFIGVNETKMSYNIPPDCTHFGIEAVSDSEFLFTLEIITSDEEPEEEVESEGVDISVELMKKPFNPAFINIENKLLNIDLLIKRINQKDPEIELNTENYFQRKDDLWDVQKQSRLIESILIRFPLPAFYFDGSNKNKWLVVDGLQRLSSIRNFAVRKNLKLTNLEFLTQLNGMGYDDLDRDLQRIIEETQIVAYIINPGTPEDVKFNIFKRINTGGLILEAQEIRHALNQGEPARFIAALAESEEFMVATSYSIKSQRMEDRDFANRFLCFYLFGYENYTPDLDTFMSNAMAHINKMTPSEKTKCILDFKESMILNFEIFGIYAFRKQLSKGARRKPLNKAIFDVFSVVFAKLDKNQRSILKSKNQLVEKLFIELLNDDEIFFSAVSTSTSDKNRVNYRFKSIYYLVNSVILNS